MRNYAKVKRVRGEACRYWVLAEDSKKWHFVDLTERDGEGMCDCRDFQTRANVNWKKQGYSIPWGRAGRTDCKHLHAAKRYYDKAFTVPFRASMANGIDDETRKFILKIVNANRPKEDSETTAGG